MSLIIPRNFKRAKAQDAAAPKFRPGQEVIVKTKYTEPYRARIVGLWDMSRNGPYDEQGYLIKNIKGGGVESMPEHALSLATAKDSAAQDAQFKIGDIVTLSKSHPRNPGKSGKIVQIFPTGFIKVKFADGSTDIEMEKNVAADSIADKEREYTRLYELAQKNITFYAAKGDSAKVSEWKRKADEYKRLAQEAENAASDAADSRAADAVSTGLKDANGNNLNVGDVVVHTSSRLHGKVVGKYNSYLINVKWEGGFVEECNPDDVRKWSPVGIQNSTNPIIRKAMNAATARSADDDLILRLCKPGNVIKKAKMGNLHEVRYGAGYIYPLVGRDKVLLKVFGSLSEANRSPLMNA